MSADRKKIFRSRILGDSPAPISSAESYRLIELPASPPESVIRKQLTVEWLDDLDESAGYYRESFVRGKIENWAGRPAGDGNRHPLVVSDAMAEKMEKRRGSQMPVDHTDADVTARTFAVMDENTARVLQWFHTSALKLNRIAYEVGVSYTECRRLIEQGHVTFCEEWERQSHILRDELRRMRPVIDPSANAEPQLTLPRPKPFVAECTTTREGAPVLRLPKTGNLTG